MSPLDLHNELQALTNKLAALWVEADEAAKQAPRFGAMRGEMLERRQAIADSYRLLIALNALVGTDFVRAEGIRWRAMTSERHLQSDAAKGQH